MSGTLSHQKNYNQVNAFNNYCHVVLMPCFIHAYLKCIPQQSKLRFYDIKRITFLDHLDTCMVFIRDELAVEYLAWFSL